MNKMLTAAMALIAIGTGSAFAQPATTNSTSPPAVAASGANNTTAAPVAGANSFTMGQAQKRIEDQGYTQVTGLAQDAQSIWRGHAMKDSKAMNVALDYQGNVTAN
jgi:hypothetical protein